jgi:hypothetical protein
MSVSPAAAYALDEAGKVFSKSVGQILEKWFSGKFFTWNKVGEVGDDHFLDTQIAPGKEGEIHAAFTLLDSGAEFPAKNIPIPWVGLDKSFSVEDLRKIASLGGNAAVLAELAEEVLIPMEKAIWIGSTVAANHIKVDGFNFNGAGTFLDPKYLDGGASAGKWDAYGKAMKDLVHLHSLIIAAGGSRPALFYPATAQEAFDFLLPNSATSFASISIKQYAESLFEGGVHAVGDDRAALCCMTGAAETEGSFQICAADLDNCVVSYTQEPMYRPVPYDILNERGHLRYDARIVPSYRVKKIGSYYYKLVAEIDSIDLST